MSEILENQVTAALTFKVPQKVGWSVQSGDQSWSGRELMGLVECLAKESNGPMTLSLSIIFELKGDRRTERLSDDPPQF